MEKLGSLKTSGCSSTQGGITLICITSVKQSINYSKLQLKSVNCSKTVSKLQ